MTEPDRRFSRHTYGPSPEQFAELWLPKAEPPSNGWPVVVLVHGGFWRDRYHGDLMHPLAADLIHRGWAVWNIEYRRVGTNGGDPMATLHDVARASDAVAESQHRMVLDLGRVVMLGHSAGGHLALWLGGRAIFGSDIVTVPAALRPRLVIGQAAVLDLHRAAADRLGDGATQDFLGGEPSERPDQYEAAQPRLVSSLMHLVHGELDTTVPAHYSEEAVDAAGTPIPHTIVPGADHMAMIDPGSTAWAVQVGLIDAAIGITPS